MLCGEKKPLLRVLDRSACGKLLDAPTSSDYSIDGHACGIERIECTAGISRARALDLSFNKLRALRNLEPLAELRELKAYGNAIADIDGLVKCNKLEHLELHSNAIERISANVTTLTALKLLRLNNNRIQTVENLHKCRRLQELHRRLHPC